MRRTKVVIMGAAGRDFHNFNTLFRGDQRYEVVAFTAAQIPDIEGRTYPPELAGSLYPNGIPIRPEEPLDENLRELRIDLAVLAYSDVSLEEIARTRERVERCGARFATFDPDRCLLRSRRPCVAVCAVRTGCGKSQVSRHLVAAVALVADALGQGDARALDLVVRDA